MSCSEANRQRVAFFLLFELKNNPYAKVAYWGGGEVLANAAAILYVPFKGRPRLLKLFPQAHILYVISHS